VRFRISRPACIGNGRCVDVAPEVFGLDTFNKAIVVDRAGASEEKITDAAHACPVQAVILETDGGERIFPIIE
jgi:ferredoxin